MYTIYKLCSKDEKIKDYYVGSTKDLYNRRATHKSHCNNPNSDRYNLKVYSFIRDNGGWDNWKFEELETGECEDKLERHKIERVWIEKLNATLNGNIPSRTQKEHYEENKDRILEHQRGHYQKNKDKIKQQRREYREKNRYKINEYQKQKVPCPVCGKHMRRGNIPRHKKKFHPE
jgi:hypothetical protein